MASNGGNTVPSITRSEHIGPNATGDNIEAKRVALFQWNPDAGDNGEWERADVNGQKYATKITESGTITYIAKAAPGSLQSSAVWQAQKIDESSGTVITWADGNANFDNVATDLTSLSYS